jgi:hypothetical protein
VTGALFIFMEDQTAAYASWKLEILNFWSARLKNTWGNISIHLSQFVSNMGIICLKTNIEACAVELGTISVLHAFQK